MSFVSSPQFGTRVQRALGDVASGSYAITVDDIKKLQQQVNRYTQDGGAPIQLRIGTAPVPVTGELDAQTATRALWIMQLRAGTVALAWEDVASKQLVDEAMKAWSDPAAFVRTNLARVTQVLKLFADKSGIPAAKGGLLPGLTPTMIAGGLAAAALLFIFRGGKR